MIHPDDLRKILAAYVMGAAPEPAPEPVFRRKTWNELFAGKAMPDIGESWPVPQAESPIASVNHSGKRFPGLSTDRSWLRPYREPDNRWRQSAGPPGTAFAYPPPDDQDRPRTEVAYQRDNQPNIDIRLMSADSKGEDKEDKAKPAPTPPPSFRRKSMGEILAGKGTPGAERHRLTPSRSPAPLPP